MLNPTAEYKEANRAAIRTFDQKYGFAISTATQEIIDKYGIDPESKLARIIKISLTKCILGLEKKLDIYSDWFNKHNPSRRELSKDFNRNYPNTNDLLERMIIGFGPSPEMDKLLRVDIGRNKVVSNIHDLISKHKGSIDADIQIAERDPEYKVLGSIIGRTIKIYNEPCKQHVPATFPRTPKQTMARLRALREKYEPTAIKMLQQ